MPQDVTATHRVADGLARTLGWFSLALGATEILFPNAVKRSTGAPGPEGLYSAYGWREVVTGALILTAPAPANMVWLRVAGDALDLATMAPALKASNPYHNPAKAAFGFLAATTAVDLLVAIAGGRSGKTSP